MGSKLSNLIFLKQALTRFEASFNGFEASFKKFVGSFLTLLKRKLKQDLSGFWSFLIVGFSSWWFFSTTKNQLLKNLAF